MVYNNMAKMKDFFFSFSESHQKNIERFGHESLWNGRGSLDRLPCGEWKQLTSPH